ncbi:MAG: hypothetical protein M0Z81_05655 [Deltaproteobacteria bacterium]|jgi:hypothetical protein|nr:hypothetical protein [Deltaproteobacteria bacterium]
MESNGSCGTVDAELILDQLLKFVGQLAEFENDAQVDIKVLSDECAKRTEALKRLLPNELKNSAAASGEILEKMRALYERTQACLDALHRKSNAVSANLQRLSRTKHAVNAYSHRRDCCR